MRRRTSWIHWLLVRAPLVPVAVIALVLLQPAHPQPITTAVPTRTDTLSPESRLILATWQAQIDNRQRHLLVLEGRAFQSVKVMPETKVILFVQGRHLRAAVLETVAGLCGTVAGASGCMTLTAPLAGWRIVPRENLNVTVLRGDAGSLLRFQP